MDYEITVGESVAARRRIPFRLPSDVDGYTPVTGATVSGIIYKLAGAGSAVGGTFTEVDAVNSPGVYYYEATAGEVDTEGFALFSFSASGAVTQIHFVRIGASNSNVKDTLDTTKTEIQTNIDEAKGVGFTSATDTLHKIRQKIGVL